MVTGTTISDYYDVNSIVKRKIKELGVKNILNNIPTEEIEVFLRSKKINKIRDGR